MCGISLIIGPESPERNLRIQQMHAAQLHRGLEDGLALFPDFAAAVRRLPIVDLHGSRQPMHIDSGKSVILYNGEVYNFRSLRADLIARHGVRFASEGDTETLARGVMLEGLSFLRKVHGQFAFALLDGGGGQALLARDPFGIKPLYFQCLSGEFRAASEMKAFPPGAPINALPPGGWIRVHAGGLLDSGHWFDLSEAAGAPAEQSAAEETLFKTVRHALTDAIEERLDTELPVAIVYSGGLDSSIVLELARRRRPDVLAVTVGAPGSEDLEFARRFCADRGVRSLVVERRRLTAAEVRRAAIESELGEYGDLINAAVSAPVFQAIREQGIRIALSGDGSDELFGGYDMYARAGSAEEQQLRLYKLNQLHRTELQRVDRMGMAATVEVRTPFLDLRVARIALGLPETMRRRNGVEKFILRAAFAADLPDYITARKKNPLSHSSGLHESARLFRPLFAHWRRRSAGETMRRDFSSELRRSRYNVDLAAARARRAKDYSMLEKLRDFAGALYRNVRG